MENRIKGQTLDQILDANFDSPAARADILERLNIYEAQMEYAYINGFENAMKWLRDNGISTALVTSSNIPKMNCVYKAHPEFKQMFDAVLTSEDFTQSKPHPECYLKAADVLGVAPDKCLVFEDSFNGLRAGRAANMPVVGLATTNPASKIAALCDVVVEDFTHFDETVCLSALDHFKKQS